MESPTQRRRDRTARFDAPARPARGGALPLPTRDEFRARCFPAGTGWRALLQLPSGRGLLTLLFGIALGIGPLALMGRLAELTIRDPRFHQLPWWWLFPPCWGLMLLGVWVLHRSGAVDLRGRGLTCPSCDRSLLYVSPFMTGPNRYELV
ncbi:MAG TPA: hypothetical protein VEZ47_10535, partial [Gemmatirosa sp.]|nr:hypothetical protein [Gemmatirosa sp.]